ncbi:MAG: redoxin domain-containing protein [Desulfomonilaceae bacterium]
MLRYQSVAIFLLLIIKLFPGANAAAALPDQLRDQNFNLYSTPCPANDMALRDLKGREITLAGQQGKVVILNFWKVDCPPCSMEKPILERIYKKYASRGLEIVAVNLVDGQDRILPYVQRGGYSFTFAFDPAHRFSVRQQALRSGTPTTFVVNSNSEAIYEMPGVPTTYVINRQGQVVGNAVGLVNWEQGPLTELLESLLGPPPAVIAQNPPAYSGAAQQGLAQASSSPEAASSTKGQTQRFVQVAQAQPPQSSTRQDVPALSFQGVAGPQQPAASNPPVSSAPAGPSSVQAPTMPQAYEPPATAVRPQKKPQPARTTKPLERTPKPYNPAASGVYGSPAQPSATRGAVRSRTSPTVVGPAAPPAAQPLASTVPSAAQPAASMPYLPPASRYTPSGSQRPPTNVVPDDNGTVTARIPSNAPVPGFDRFGTAGLPPSTSLPPAQPVGTKNPIDGFILDSFGRPGAQFQGAKPSRASDTPASSLFGQIGQDVQDLGSGIKDTFSRIVPGR